MIPALVVTVRVQGVTVPALVVTVPAQGVMVPALVVTMRVQGFMVPAQGVTMRVQGVMVPALVVTVRAQGVVNSPAIRELLVRSGNVGVQPCMLHAAQGRRITFAMHFFTPTLQVAEARQVVVKFTFKQLSIGSADQAGIDALVGYVNAQDPGMGLNLLSLFHNFWLSNLVSEFWIETFIIGP